MGQYHRIYNLDKKECIDAHMIDSGAKLLEQCGYETSTATAIWLLLSNSNGRGGGDAPAHPLIGNWAGDRLVVQGDYAIDTDTSFIPKHEIHEYTDISQQIVDLFNVVFDL